MSTYMAVNRSAAVEQSGRKGMKWYHHIFGENDPRAKYANGEDISKATDAELRDYIQRKNLEKQYRTAAYTEGAIEKIVGKIGDKLIEKVANEVADTMFGTSMNALKKIRDTAFPQGVFNAANIHNASSKQLNSQLDRKNLEDRYLSAFGNGSTAQNTKANGQQQKQQQQKQQQQKQQQQQQPNTTLTDKQLTKLLKQQKQAVKQLSRTQQPKQQPKQPAQKPENALNEETLKKLVQMNKQAAKQLRMKHSDEV